MPTQEQLSTRRHFLAALRLARINAGVTQAGLAARLDHPQSFVSKYETGERRIDFIELREICRALGISVVGFVQAFEDGSL